MAGEAGAGERTSVGREVFPDVEERIGEDPARFLDQEIFGQPDIRRLRKGADGPRCVPDTATGDPIEFIACRIRGIDRLKVVAAWQWVERHLLRSPDEDPDRDEWPMGGRPRINELLADRAREIETNGEREEHLEGVDERRIKQRTEPTDDQEEARELWRHIACGSLNVEQESAYAWICNDCDQTTNRVEEVEPDAVVADGGRSP